MHAKGVRACSRRYTAAILQRKRAETWSSVHWGLSRENQSGMAKHQHTRKGVPERRSQTYPRPLW